MNGRSPWRAAALLLCAVLLPNGCKDSTSPGGPGQLTVTISGSAGSGAAFLVTLSGQDVSDPVAASDGHLVYSLSSGGTTRVAVIGQVASGALFKFTVPDVGQARDYTVHLEQVAGADNRRLATSDFSLAVTR